MLSRMRASLGVARIAFILTVLRASHVVSAAGGNGKSSCPCLEWAGLDSQLVGGNVIYRPIGSGVSYQWPGNYGNGACQAHDSGLSPMCGHGVNSPSWCKADWCWVSKANCQGTSYMRSVLFASVSDLYFSYGTCGSADTFSAWAQGNLGALPPHANLAKYLQSSRLQIEDAYNQSSGSVSLECIWQDQCTCRDCSQASVWNQRISAAEAGTWLMPGVGTQAKQLASCMSKAVGDTFRRVAAAESDVQSRVGYQYFSDQASGSLIQWPLVDWCPSQGQGYDPRYRPWYAAGATGPKDVVIVVDISGSMGTANRFTKAREAAEAILNTLVWKDFASIVLFNHAVHAVSSDVLEPMTNANRARLIGWLNAQNWKMGGTNFKEPMTKAFDIIDKSARGGKTSTCQRAIMFLTDGVADFAESDYTNVKSKATEWGVTVFTYTIGSSASSLVTKRLACENRGIYYPVADNEDLKSVMAKYFEYYATGETGCSGPAFSRYVDANTGKTLYAGCMAMKDRSPLEVSKDSLLGVACMDLDMLASVDQMKALPNNAWDQVVCEMSDASKKCRHLYLSECHLQKLRLRVSGQSVCNQTSPSPPPSQPCPCLNKACQDDENFIDEKGWHCDTWIGDNCDEATTKFQYSSSGQAEVKRKCKRSCGLCPVLDPCPAGNAEDCSTSSVQTSTCRACTSKVSGVTIDGRDMCCPSQVGTFAPKCAAAVQPSPPAPGDDGDDGDGQGAGVIGIVVGCLAGIAVLGAAAWFFYMRGKKSQTFVSKLEVDGDSEDPQVLGLATKQPTNQPTNAEAPSPAVIAPAPAHPTANPAAPAPRVATPGPSERKQVPKNWKHTDPREDFFSLESVPELLPQIQKMLDETFKKVKTRDRRDGSEPTRMLATDVRRVENNVLYQRYLAELARIKKKRSHRCTQLSRLNGGVAKTISDSAGGLHVTGWNLEDAANETLLWHGTSPEGAIGITKGGFDLSRAGSGAGSMYGPGVYLAEASSKSDEYAKDDQGGLYQGTFCLLLCRAVLGEPMCLTAGGDSVHTTVKAAMDSGVYDSVLGDRQASVGTYREFVVYREDQVYPEYIVLYKRSE